MNEFDDIIKNSKQMFPNGFAASIMILNNGNDTTIKCSNIQSITVDQYNATIGNNKDPEIIHVKN